MYARLIILSQASLHSWDITTFEYGDWKPNFSHTNTHIHTQTHIYMYCARTYVINMRLEKCPHKPKTKHVLQPNNSKKQGIHLLTCSLFQLMVYFFFLKNGLLKRRKE